MTSEEKVVSVPEKAKSRLLSYYEKYMFVVGICGQMVFYAQGIKIFQTQSASDVSLFGFLLGLISVTSWLIYGVAIKNRVLVIANIFAVIGALFVVTGILLY